MNDRIWLSSPHMGGSEQKYVKEAFDTNWIEPLGTNVDSFEVDLENYLDDEKYVATLSTGTAAIHLALILLGVKNGDEVICQSFTFSASANPILYLGAKPVFVDSELDTWNICPIELEKAIKNRISLGKKPKVIIAVHLYGNPYKVEEIKEIAEKYDISILEDSAEAFGSTYKGKKCGTFGDIGIISFNGNKIITPSGGGAIVVNSLELKTRAIFATQSRDPGLHYQHSKIGYNYRMSNVCAGIGRGQMEVIDSHIKNRRATHSFYLELFKHIDGVDVFSVLDKDYFSNCWLTSIIINPNNLASKSKEDIIVAFQKENIECRPLWKPLHLQPIFSSHPFYGNNNAEYLFENGLCLPSGSNLTSDEKNRISNVIKNIFKIL